MESTKGKYDQETGTESSSLIRKQALSVPDGNNPKTHPHTVPLQMTSVLLEGEEIIFIFIVESLLRSCIM